MENLKSKSPRKCGQTQKMYRHYTQNLRKSKFFYFKKLLMKKLISFFILFISSQFFAKNENEALFFAFLFAFASYQWAIEAKKEEKRKKYMYNFDL